VLEDHLRHSPLQLVLAGPCLDYFALLHCMGLLRPIMQTAFGALSTTYARSPQHSGSDIVVAPDPSLQQELSWHQVQGVRMKRALGFVADPSAMLSLLLDALVEEPLRLLTAWFLKTTQRRKDPCQWPALLDLCCPEFSPVTAIMQYMSGLLQRKAPRLDIMCQMLGCTELGHHGSEEAATLLRNACLSTSAWLYRRHVLWAKSYPWKLASLADGRVPQDHRNAVAREAVSAKGCCQGLFSRRLCAGRSVDDLTAPGMTQALYCWASGVSAHLSIADVERMHRLSKSILVTNTMAWPQFAAMHVLKESVALLEHEPDSHGPQAVVTERHALAHP
jgi:hypothetical protein